MTFAIVGIAALACLAGPLTPGGALAIGAGVGLTAGDPTSGKAQDWSNLLLKVSVVGLGFGLPLPTILKTAHRGLLVICGGVGLALIVGSWLRRLLDVDRSTGILISGGTAICGGSAIAGLAPAIGASSLSTGIAMATVFVLNGVALYVFPWLGQLVGLSQEQFGVWAAIGIHDTSSVVGAAAQYGDRALEVATVLKLTRALWIIPLVGAFAAIRRRECGQNKRERLAIPWFIVLFIMAAVLRGAWPAASETFGIIEMFARRLLVLALLFVGLGLTRQRMRDVGGRAFMLGLSLWTVVAASGLAVVVAFPGTGS